ncbi:conjugative transposon protein TraK [Flavitalea sp. BT771]|uniref:conjugative transposon protein TraK n=1 Tax=Flavitalea sp. BT771 TaxID=3063329 RepID=UPI0026E23E30|nr:conjugative transposon protein TraK [Flavitalea sp. BT771]MDO6431568.1 conjugative transposon protein TraK [Flavitalea sp. BT771]MDV6220476.1 conjugative transposon protein TraK [Flavitalea sp. BT771]
MFPKTRNLESSFRLIRGTCMVVIVGVLGLGGYMFFVASEAVSRAQGRVYILANGKVLEALASDRKENIPVEARDHVRTFHGLFFTLDPDEKVIGENLSRALYLADGSAKRVYENLKESGYYANVISANISQRLVIDSIRLDMANYPFYFRCYGQETIIRTTSIVTRDLVTEGWLRDVSRSDNNAHGFLIERWSILENKDVKVEQR